MSSNYYTPSTYQIFAKDERRSPSDVTRQDIGTPQTLTDSAQLHVTSVPFSKTRNASVLTLNGLQGSVSQPQMVGHPNFHKNSGSSFSSLGHPNSLPQNYPINMMLGEQSNNTMFYSANPLINQSFNQNNHSVHFNNPFPQYSDSNLHYNTSVNITQQRSLPMDIPLSGFKPDFSPFLKGSFDHQKPSNSVLFSSNFNLSVPQIATGSIYNKKSNPIKESSNSSNPETKSNAELISNIAVDPLSSGTLVYLDGNRKDDIQLEKPSMGGLLDDRKLIKHRPLCNLCGKTFSRASSLKTHIFTVHERNRRFQCPYEECSKKFTTNSNMKRHVRIHRRRE